MSSRIGRSLLPGVLIAQMAASSFGCGPAAEVGAGSGSDGSAVMRFTVGTSAAKLCEGTATASVTSVDRNRTVLSVAWEMPLGFFYSGMAGSTRLFLLFTPEFGAYWFGESSADLELMLGVKVGLGIRASKHLLITCGYSYTMLDGFSDGTELKMSMAFFGAARKF